MNEPVRTTDKPGQADLWSLVLSAAAIPHAVKQNGQGWRISVRPWDREQAAREISEFEAENAGWPPAPPVHAAIPKLSNRHPPTVIMMGLLVIIFLYSGPWSEGAPWFERGAVDSRQILVHGEWWRLATGLSLHADAAHLLGNVLIGGFLIHFLSLAVGTGLCWFLVTASGIAGNLLNVYLHGPGHLSVGFSTAVFGTIGILTGSRCMRAGTIALLEVLSPLAAGVALLAFLGASGQRTDLGAHFFGLLAGTLLGVALQALPGQRTWDIPFVQTALFISTMLFLASCWKMAWG